MVEIHALERERNELARERGELAARVIELQAALRAIESLGLWDEALEYLIQHRARLLPPAPELAPAVNVASDSQPSERT